MSVYFNSINTLYSSPKVITPSGTLFFVISKREGEEGGFDEKVRVGKISGNNGNNFR